MAPRLMEKYVETCTRLLSIRNKHSIHRMRAPGNAGEGKNADFFRLDFVASLNEKTRASPLQPLARLCEPYG